MVVDEIPTVSKEFHSKFDKLKSLVTDSVFNLNKKNHSCITYDNYANFAFCTNNMNSVKIEQSDQRFFVLKVNNEKVGFPAYWNSMHSEVFTKEVGILFYNYLVNDFKDAVDIRRIPDTKIKEEIKVLGRSSIDQFMKEVGEMDIEPLFYQRTYTKKGSESDPNFVYFKKKDLYTVYKLWCESSGETPLKMKYLKDSGDGKGFEEKRSSTGRFYKFEYTPGGVGYESSAG
jgi:hypothetical protein